LGSPRVVFNSFEEEFCLKKLTFCFLKPRQAGEDGTRNIHKFSLFVNLIENKIDEKDLEYAFD
jgi:hypothetical protein